LVVFLLASAIGISALAQEAQPVTSAQDTPPSTAQQQLFTSPSPRAAKEEFWKSVNSFVLKKWPPKKRHYLLAGSRHNRLATAPYNKLELLSAEVTQIRLMAHTSNINIVDLINRELALRNI
jgi:hypothetical protein